jgi:membrane-associated protein
MDFLEFVMDVFKRLDFYLEQGCFDLGPWLYVILFAVIFCETGLVVTPFLPGDSLLFAVGAISALPGCPLHPVLITALLIVAGVLGDAVNYAIGKKIGPKIFSKDTGRWLNKRHLDRTHAFYEKHGGKTIIIARFVPIIRTFAPFVAGIGKMGYARFALFNVTGAVSWVITFIAAGYAFGNIPAVKRNFQLVIIGIILVSILPIVIEFYRARKAAKAAKPA